MGDMMLAEKKRGRPPKRPDEPIKAPLPVKVLVKGILRAGPHPKEWKVPKSMKGRTKLP